MAVRDVDVGQELAFRFLAACQSENVSGVGIINAAGNVLTGFFMTHYRDHAARMVEVEQFCKTLREEIENAHARTELGRKQ